MVVERVSGCPCGDLDSFIYEDRVSYTTLSIKFLSLLFSFEMVFALFLRSGRFKSAQFFHNFPFDLTLFLLLLGVLISVVIFYRRRLNFSPIGLLYLAIFLVFILYACLSLEWTPGTVYAREKILKLIIICLFCIVSGSFVIAYDVKRIRRFLICLVFVDLWIAGNVAIASLHHVPGTFLNALAPENAKGTYLGLSAVLCCLFLISVLYVFFSECSQLMRMITLLLLPCLLYLILDVGGRGPLFCMIITFMVLTIFRMVPFFLTGVVVFKKQLILGLLAILLVAGFFCFSPSFLARVEKSTTVQRIAVFFQENHGGESANQRMIYYKTALNMFATKPVYGWGIGSFPLVNEGIDKSGYPHNIILEVFAELGIIGALIFIIFLFLPLVRCNYFLNKDIRFELLVIMALFIYYFTWSLITGNITSIRELYVMSSILFVAEFKTNYLELRFYG